uniref:WW domain-containing protein n=1 Tax=Caenorhabditis tropicalis TaxID=1561998 RepID=A0A1I7URW6_9PELO
MRFLLFLVLAASLAMTWGRAVATANPLPLSASNETLKPSLIIILSRPTHPTPSSTLTTAPLSSSSSSTIGSKPIVTMSPSTLPTTETTTPSPSPTTPREHYWFFDEFYSTEAGWTPKPTTPDPRGCYDSCEGPDAGFHGEGIKVFVDSNLPKLIVNNILDASTVSTTTPVTSPTIVTSTECPKTSDTTANSATASTVMASTTSATTVTAAKSTIKAPITPDVDLEYMAKTINNIEKLH